MEETRPYVPETLEREVHDRLSQEKDKVFAQIHSGHDVEGRILWNANRKAVIEPSPQAKGIFGTISREYQELGAIIPDLSDPGKVNEAISLLDGMIGTYGLTGVTTMVEVPPDASEGEKHRALQERVRELHATLPGHIADHELDRYATMKAEQSLAESDINLRMGLSAVAEVSRAEARTLAFDHARRADQIRQEGNRLLSTSGERASTGAMFAEVRSRADQRPNRFDAPHILRAVDQRRESERKDRDDARVAVINARSSELNDLFNKYDIPNDLTANQLHIVFGEIPEALNEVLASRGSYKNAELVTARAKVLIAEVNERLLNAGDNLIAAGERVDEKVAQAKNIVRGIWHGAVTSTVEGARQKAQAIHEKWRAQRNDAQSEYDRGRINEERSFYNRRHEKAVSKQMKTESELVSRMMREQGISRADAEMKLRERREQVANVHFKNPAQEVFAQMLHDHVQLTGSRPVFIESAAPAPVAPSPVETKQEMPSNLLETQKIEYTPRSSSRLRRTPSDSGNVTKATDAVGVDTQQPFQNDSTETPADGMPAIDVLNDTSGTENSTAQSEVHPPIEEALTPIDAFRQVEQTRNELTQALFAYNMAPREERDARRNDVRLAIERANEAATLTPFEELTSITSQELLIRKYIADQRRMNFSIAQELDYPWESETYTKQRQNIINEQRQLREQILQLNNANEPAMV